MNKSSFFLLSAFFLSFFISSPLASESASRPNIIFIMLDDCSAVELSTYATAEHPAGNKTPVMDALAREGVMFNTCWATPLCMPSRALLMSGKYGSKTGVYGNKLNRGGKDFPVRHKPISKLLQENGYETAISGKWHLPGYPDDEEWGWDEYSMLGCYMTPRQEMTWGGRWFSWAKASETFLDTAIIGKNRPYYPAMYWNGAVIENGKLLPNNEETYAPDYNQKFSIDFIQKRHKKPFFLYYAMVLPHDPWLGTPDVNKPGQKTKPGFNSLIQRVEYYMDELITVIKESGFYDETLIILTADNATLRNGKGSCSELGVRVPLIIAGGVNKKKGISEALIDFSDFYPTLADVAGIKEENKELDGKSFYPLLKGEKFESRKYIFSYLDMERTIRDEKYTMDGTGGIWQCAENGNVLDYQKVNDILISTNKRDEFMLFCEQYPLPSVNEFSEQRLTNVKRVKQWPSWHSSMENALEAQDNWMNNPRRLQE